MMSMKTMAIVAHPDLGQSEWNRALVSELKKNPDIGPEAIT